jgi:hypothetical protein
VGEAGVVVGVVETGLVGGLSASALTVKRTTVCSSKVLGRGGHDFDRVLEQTGVLQLLREVGDRGQRHRAAVNRREGARLLDLEEPEASGVLRLTVSSSVTGPRLAARSRSISASRSESSFLRFGGAVDELGRFGQAHELGFGVGNAGVERRLLVAQIPPVAADARRRDQQHGKAFERALLRRRHPLARGFLRGRARVRAG